MKGYLLDTSICVFLLRDKFDVQQRLSSIKPSQCYISEVTVAELLYGAYKSAKTEANIQILNNLFKRINIVPFSESIEVFAKEKVRLNQIGKPLEDFDLLIGAAAVSRGLTLVTDNVKHFDRISGITIENWVNR